MEGDHQRKRKIGRKGKEEKEHSPEITQKHEWINKPTCKERITAFNPIIKEARVNMFLYSFLYFRRWRIPLIVLATCFVPLDLQTFTEPIVRCCCVVVKMLLVMRGKMKQENTAGK